MLFSAEFDNIQDARRLDDPLLDQGEWATEIKEADWRAAIAESMLPPQNRTKDLRLAAWLAEALSKERSFAGLCEGYELVVGLREQFWEHLYPLLEADGPEACMGSMAWPVTCSSQLIREVPLVETGKGSYSLIDWEVATSLVEAIRRDPEQADRLLREKITLEQFESVRRATPPAFYKMLHDDVAGCSVALSWLESVLDARAGDHAPGLYPVREALQAVRALVERFGDRPEPKPTVVEAKGVPQQTAQLAPGTVIETIVSGPTRACAQALNQLRDVAEFFRQTEPHSPVAYLAVHAAKWGDIPLYAWLCTVVKDDATPSQIEELLGLGDPPLENVSRAGQPLEQPPQPLDSQLFELQLLEPLLSKLQLLDVPPPEPLELALAGGPIIDRHPVRAVLASTLVPPNAVNHSRSCIDKPKRGPCWPCRR